MGKHAKKESDHKMKQELPIPLTNVLPQNKSQLEKDIELIDGRSYGEKPEGYRLKDTDYSE